MFDTNLIPNGANKKIEEEKTKSNLLKFEKMEPNSKFKIILKLTTGFSILKDYCQNSEIFILGLLDPLFFFQKNIIWHNLPNMSPRYSILFDYLRS